MTFEKVVGLVVLCLLMTGQAPVVNAQATANFDIPTVINNIITLLEQHATYGHGILQGWPRRLNGSYTADAREYLGDSVGMAGIGNVLLDCYEAGYTNTAGLLLNITTSLLHSYHNSTLGGIYWSQYAGFASGGWTGMRYGSAGIIDFLSRMSQTTLMDHAVLESAIYAAYTWMKAIRYANGSWPMTENSYTITGAEYGSAGIGNAFLELYNTFNDSIFLEEASLIVSNLEQVGTWNGSSYLVPWYDRGTTAIPEFNDLVSPSLGIGIGGIIQFLEHYAAVKQTSNNMTAGLINTILTLNQGGLWLNNSLGYITQLKSVDHGLTGYTFGSSGIADLLLQYHANHPDNKLLKTIAEVEKFLESMQITTDNGWYETAGVDEPYRYSGISLGSAGVAYFYLHLYDAFGMTRAMTAATQLLTPIYNQLIAMHLVPVDFSHVSMGYAFNKEEGLAGMAEVFLAYQQATQGQQNDAYANYYSIATAGTTYTLPSTKSETPYPSLIMAMAAISMILVYRKRIFNQTNKKRII